MTTTHFSSGNARVGFSFDTERLIRETVDRVAAGLLPTMESAAQEVADAAKAAWYGDNGVQRITGQSGDITVGTAIDLHAGEVRVSVGSADPRTTNGKPLVVYVHQAGRLSLVNEVVSRAVYEKTPKALRVGHVKGEWKVNVHNSRARGGKFLLQMLVRKPMKDKVPSMLPAIQSALDSKLRS